MSRDGLESQVDSSWQPQGNVTAFSISPDGKSLAVSLLQSGKEAIWVKQLPGGPSSRLTFGDSTNFRATWTADGRSLVYLANVNNAGGVPMMRRADGTGGVQRLLPSPFKFGQAFQTRDGKWLVARRSFFEAGAGDVYAARTGDTTLVPIATSPATEVDPTVSPDGRWIAYASDESGISEIYVRPFPDAASARWQVSPAGGSDPVWSHSGREIFYKSGRNELVTVAVAPGASF